MKNLRKKTLGSGLAASCLLLSIVALLATIQGCSSGSSSKSSPTLQTITVTAAASSVAVAATDQLTATGNYSDGSTQNLTSTATWTSATTTVATISASGLATGMAAGTSNITAASGAVTSSPYSLTVTAPATLTSIAVTAAAPSVVVGGTDQFTATGTYSDNSTQNLTSTATWVSSSTKVATIAASGLATAVAAGTTNITATSGTITSPAVVLTVNTEGGNTSGSTAILVIPAPASAADGTKFKYAMRKKPGANASASSSPAFVDAAYQPQGTTPNTTTGQYSVQVVNLDTGTSTSALIMSIAMPLTDSLGDPYPPNATGASQSELKVVVISWTSPDVQVIDATSNTIVKTYTLTGITANNVSFSGGGCSICGVTVNQTATSNEVLLDTAQGYYTMDITTGTFTALDGGTAYPAENFAFNPVTNTIMSPNYGSLFPSDNSVPVGIQLLDLTSNTLSTNDTFTDFLENSPDSAAIDESTNVGVVMEEYSGNQYLFNLGSATIASGNWTSPFTVYTIPLSGSGADMTYVAVDSLSHTLFSSEEFGQHTAVELLQPSIVSGAAPANPTGYVWDLMPNTPDTFPWAGAGDPHAVSIFTSVVDGKLYGFLVNDTQTWIAKVDLAGALAATPVASPAYPGQIDLTSYTTYLPTTQ